MINTNTICLTMIVKNESNIITRLFDSVIEIIDFYCICDTGSTDNTIQVIRDYFNEKGIPGKIIEKPFENFSFNRNIVLSESLGLSEYLLLLDADMCLEINGFQKDSLVFDYYKILQGSKTFNYENIRIVRNNGLFKYFCYTHEYIHCSNPNATWGFIENLFIKDIGDGGSKSDKFNRDIILLKKSIQEDTKDSRSYFYLGNSYRDTGQDLEAIEAYKKVLELDSWLQEKYCACKAIGKLYNKLYDHNNAVKYFLRTVDYDPERIEGIVSAVEYYYEQGLHVIVNLLYHKFKNYNKVIPTNKLFVERDKYNYLLEYYNSISAFYAEDFASGLICCHQCINNGVHVQETKKNIIFYLDKTI